MDDIGEEARLAVWRIVLVGYLIIQFVVMYELVPGFQTGFAKTTEVSMLASSLRKVQENQLLDAIDKERRNVCTYLLQSNDTAVAYAARKRDDLMRSYANLTGKNVDSVSCAELGVGH